MKTSSIRLIATVSAALLALQAGSADAEVITTLVNETITVNSSNQSPSLGLYAGGYEVAAIDGNFGTSSYAFFELDAETGSGAEAVDDSYGIAAAVLSGGTTISGSSNFGNLPYILSYGNGGPPSDFNGVSLGYLGFDFNIGNGNEYGYVEIANTTGSDAAFSATMTIVGYAYDNSGAAILVAPLSVPEPSSLVMCGIAGMMGAGYTWRRRQRAATA